MQDIHSIGTGSGGGIRVFSGGDDRRLRPHHLQQDLKCPRCESINTKFCYYNNYNLSQPRHFCKSCRRYWTKGGVLRNVPVGGGVRKTKRSKPKSKTAVAAVAHERKSSNSENSSSDSSSLTASTTATNSTAITTATEASGSNSTNSTPTLLNFNESSRSFFNIPQSSNSNTGFNPLNQFTIENIPSQIGRFTSLMTSSTDQMPQGFNIASDISSFMLHPNVNQLQWRHTDVKMGEIGSVGFLDHDRTAEIELPELGCRRSNGGLAGTEYDHGLFDLTGTVDQSYWNHSQWNVHDHDHNLAYLP